MFRVKKLSDEAVLPTKAHDTDSGYDVTIIGVAKNLGNGVCLYRTGLTIEPDPCYYVELVARSSLMKYGYMLANSVGIIDNSYRGEILVALYRFADVPELEFPMRVAQLIPRQVVPSQMVLVDQLDVTNRGEGGFGSTGK